VRARILMPNLALRRCDGIGHIALCVRKIPRRRPSGDPDIMQRAIAGFVVAGAVALSARRLGALSNNGAIAAVAVGTACAIVSWAWAAMLIFFFVSSSLLSRWRRAMKAARTGAVLEKSGPRDAWQVVANGGVFSAAGLLFAATGSVGWQAAGLGALSAAAADTWGTEIGTAIGSAPRLIFSGRTVTPGTSGAVSGSGSVATLAGACAIAGAAALWGDSRMVISTAVGGVTGALADTILGATLQERRRCDRCDESTERLVHRCGTPTIFAGGIPRFRNDAVNFASTLVGGAVSVALWAAP
jgi:uncharacterized protein (TIGR00297 family)